MSHFVSEDYMNKKGKRTCKIYRNVIIFCLFDYFLLDEACNGFNLFLYVCTKLANWIQFAWVNKECFLENRIKINIKFNT